MTEFIEYWPSEYEEDQPTCKRVYDDITKRVSSIKGIPVNNIKVMYFYGPMCNWKYEVQLTDLPITDEPAINFVTWRGDYERKQYCFWWARADRTDEYIYIGRK